MDADFVNSLRKRKDRVLLENDSFFAYLDDSPVTAGHCIIIPKQPVKSFFELSGKQSETLYDTIKDVRDELSIQYKPDGYNVVVNEGEVAGKVVNTLVIHVIPRYKNDAIHPVMSGARTTLGTYSKPEMPANPGEQLNAEFTPDQLRNLFFDEAGPNKQFYLGLKTLVRNQQGEILVLHRDDAKFRGIIDLPGGRCEHRDSDEFKTAQRELYEETKIHIKGLEFFDSFVLWDVQFQKESTYPIGLVLMIFLATEPTTSTPQLKTDEKFTDYAWLPPAEVAEMLVQYPKRIKEKIRKLA